MAFSERQTGKDFYAGWIDGSGTVTLSADYTAFNEDYEQETADMSAGNDGMRGFKATLKNWSASIEFFYTGTAGTATAARLQPGDTGTLLWGPLGSATGKPKWGIAALVAKRSRPIPFDDGIKVTVEFLPQGADYAYDGDTIVF
jgi:hypothetical protein